MRLGYVVASLVAMLGLFCSAARAVPFTVVYGDADGEGFFDPEHGGERRAALEFAVDQWAATLGGSVPIALFTTMDPLGGTGANAVLASGGPVSIHRNFANARPEIWYGAALASELGSRDANGLDIPEITLAFNGDVDGPEVLGSIGWYYGLDGEAGVDIDFVTIALHEIGHGLNFFELVDPISGGWQSPDGPGIFDLMLLRPGIGPLTSMRTNERLAAVVSPGDLLWVGPSVTGFTGVALPVYSPDPAQPGSSIGHWDPVAAPGELMGPFYSGAMHDPGALLPALEDMGWEVAAPTPTPRASPATPTATYALRATATPDLTPRPRREMAYVTNFDDGTVSAIDTAEQRVVDTITVGDRPLGVAASPDGTRIYVANFGDGTLAVVSAGYNRVVDTLVIGGAPNGVVVTPDGDLAVVTDTAGDAAAIVTTSTRDVTTGIPAGAQPSAVALGLTGRMAFIADFSGQTVTAVDLDLRKRRAIIPMRLDALVGIAIRSDTGIGYVVGLSSPFVTMLNTDALQRGDPVLTSLLRAEQLPEDIALSNDNRFAYMTNQHRTSGGGILTVFVTASNQRVVNILVGLVPEAVAVSQENGLVYVTTTGSNVVAVVDPMIGRVVAGVAVGTAPMGIALASVPSPPRCDGDCDGDGLVSTAELVQAVTIALGDRSLESCAALDRDRNAVATLDEVVGAVARALGECPG